MAAEIAAAEAEARAEAEAEMAAEIAAAEAEMSAEAELLALEEAKAEMAAEAAKAAEAAAAAEAEAAEEAARRVAAEAAEVEAEIKAAEEVAAEVRGRLEAVRAAAAANEAQVAKKPGSPLKGKGKGSRRQQQSMPKQPACCNDAAPPAVSVDVAGVMASSDGARHSPDPVAAAAFARLAAAAATAAHPEAETSSTKPAAAARKSQPRRRRLFSPEQAAAAPTPTSPMAPLPSAFQGDLGIQEVEEPSDAAVAAAAALRTATSPPAKEVRATPSDGSWADRWVAKAACQRPASASQSVPLPRAKPQRGIALSVPAGGAKPPVNVSTVPMPAASEDVPLRSPLTAADGPLAPLRAVHGAGMVPQGRRCGPSTSHTSPGNKFGLNRSISLAAGRPSMA